MSAKVMNTKELVAFVMALLSGLGMLAQGRMMYGGFGHRVGGWGGHHHHFGWERSVAGHFGLWFPWVGIVAGSIVLVSAIMIYFVSRHQRSLSTTIIAASAFNLFFGMGGMLPSLLGIAGGIVAIAPDQTSES